MRAIYIGGTTDQGLFNAGVFTNNSNLTITNAAFYSFDNHGECHNNGQVVVNTPGQQSLFHNGRDFYNNQSGEVIVYDNNGSTHDAVVNFQSLFHNRGLIEVEQENSSGYNFCVDNSVGGNFINFASGEINAYITGTTGGGLNNSGSVFKNYGDIHIELGNGTDEKGILNFANFRNFANGNIQITVPGSGTGIRNTGGGGLHVNQGRITINSSYSMRRGNSYGSIFLIVSPHRN